MPLSACHADDVWPESPRVPPLDQQRLSPGMWVAIFVSIAGGLVLVVAAFLAVPMVW